MRENTDQKNSEYGHASHSDSYDHSPLSQNIAQTNAEILKKHQQFSLFRENKAQ